MGNWRWNFHYSNLWKVEFTYEENDVRNVLITKVVKANGLKEEGRIKLYNNYIIHAEESNSL